MVRSIRRRLSQYRYSAWVLDGVERATGCPLRILFTGPASIDKDYVAHLGFREAPRESRLGRHWVFNPLRFRPKRAGQYSLVITEVHRRFMSSRHGRGFFVPCWVEGRVLIEEALRLLGEAESLKSDLRKIRKHGFTYEVTRDRDQYARFYQEMYAPYISMKFQKEGALHSLEQILEVIDRSDLLMVMEDNIPIAGELIVYNKVPLLFCVGVKEGDPAYVKKSVLTAAYYFAFLHLKEKGYEEVDLGACRGFLLDGVLQYKKRWGLRLTHYRESVFFVEILKDDEGARAFLLNNPFLFVDSQGIGSAGFIEKSSFPTHQSFQKYVRSLMMPGITRCVVHQLSEGELLSPPEGFPANVQVSRFRLSPEVGGDVVL